jgi:hypothetical protein
MEMIYTHVFDNDILTFHYTAPFLIMNRFDSLLNPEYIHRWIHGLTAQPIL